MIEMKETIGIPEMKEMKKILDKKIKSYFGDGQENKKDVGYACLLKQVANINKVLIDNGIDVSKEEVVVIEEVESVKPKRKYTKKTIIDSGGSRGYGSYDSAMGYDSYRSF